MLDSAGTAVAKQFVHTRGPSFSRGGRPASPPTLEPAGFSKARRQASTTPHHHDRLALRVEACVRAGMAAPPAPLARLMDPAPLPAEFPPKLIDRPRMPHTIRAPPAARPPHDRLATIRSAAHPASPHRSSPDRLFPTRPARATPHDDGEQPVLVSPHVRVGLLPPAADPAGPGRPPGLWPMVAVGRDTRARHTGPDRRGQLPTIHFRTRRARPSTVSPGVLHLSRGFRADRFSSRAYDQCQCTRTGVFHVPFSSEDL
jgi:hypothetical protein